MAEQLHQTHLLSEYLEDELSMIQRQEVEAHLQTCTACRQELSLLCCTINALQQLPLATPSSDFVKNLDQRIDWQEKQREMHGKDSLPHATDQQPMPEAVACVFSVLASPMRALRRKASSLDRMLRLPLQAKIPLYACVAFLVLSIMVFHVASEKLLLSPPQSELQVAPLPAQQVAPVADTPIQPVDVTTPTPQPFTLDSPLSTTPGRIAATHSLRWRIASSEPAVLRRQVKELTAQIEGATIVQEQEDLLLISLPPQELGAFREKLAKLGTSTLPERELVPDASATILSITFIREPSIAHPHDSKTF